MPYTYNVKGQKVQLKVDNYFVAVRFSEPSARSERARVSKAAGCGEFADRIELPREKYTVLPVPRGRPPRAKLRSGVEALLKKAPETERTAPVFLVGENKVVATDRMIIGFKQEAAGNAKLLKKRGMEILSSDGRKFVVRLPASEDPFEGCDSIGTESGVDYAEPDFVTIGAHVQRVAPSPLIRSRPSPFSSDQYAMRITKANQAWAVQAGDPRVTIAVLDEGVDSAHEDLAGAIVGTFDGVDNDTFQEPNGWDGHGTACAGLAAAMHSPELGIKGVAGGCTMSAIRIAYSPSPGARWITRNSWISRSIDWAWQQGASVLSNSWGGGAPSSAIIDSFEDARTKGRNGKGCVIVVAAGNASGPVDFPGNLPNILTVSASNEFDEFKTKTSRDGETWWGSNLGPEVDLAAPGVHNLTTDITGSAGYDSGNYTPAFNGTSSACPLVAGAAALVISTNPQLTEAEVREVLRATADKVGAAPYTNGRNDEMGFGRLNVLEAVRGTQSPSQAYSTTHAVMKPTAIKDMAESSIQVAVGDTRPIVDIRVTVDIEHTWIGDLQVSIEAPAGSGVAPVVLHDKTGSGTDDIKRTYDKSDVSDLAFFIGKSLPGMWTLRVGDSQPDDEGTVNSVALEFDF